MTALDQHTINTILDYWFADIGEGFDIAQQHRLWYGSNAEVDRDIEQRFGAYLIEAIEGGFNHWQDSPQGSLALVVLLDQMSRNIHRGSAQAYAGDQRARAIVQKALAAEFDKQLSYVQRSFFYMPLEHSESLADQLHCVALFEQLLIEVPEQGKTAIQSSLDFAIRHRDIIKRFGRFPHRNVVLMRIATPAEQKYLDEGGARFGQ